MQENDSINVVGQIISGQHGEILVREKSGKKIGLGDLLVAENGNGSITILQVYDLRYGSQIPASTIEMASGLNLEGFKEGGAQFLENNLRNYVLALTKALIVVESGTPRIPKSLPVFFSSIRNIMPKDLSFMLKNEWDKPLFLGFVRSASRALEIPVILDGEKALTHHILIPATTGRGKSNLVKVLLWNLLASKYSGVLVLDPHDEYYGRNSFGLKDHPLAKENLVSYSPKPAKGAYSLLVNLSVVKPWHFRGVLEFTDAQRDALEIFHRKYGASWLSEIMRAELSSFESEGIQEGTLGVLKRKLGVVLNIYADESGVMKSRSSVFSATGGESTIKDIIRHLEEGKKVILDTSSVSNNTEILIASIIAGDMFERYKFYKSEGTLDQKPLVSIVLEEAPRVLGADAMHSGGNIFSTIAREGRKFRVGLLAVTQLSSVIPREVLTNMNTKIILGNELLAERNAIIESAAQDLSTDSRSIASLDTGEAIVSSVFTKFAIPITIPRFEDYEKELKEKKSSEKTVFIG